MYLCALVQYNRTQDNYRRNGCWWSPMDYYLHNQLYDVKRPGKCTTMLPLLLIRSYFFNWCQIQVIRNLLVIVRNLLQGRLSFLLVNKSILQVR